MPIPIGDGKLDKDKAAADAIAAIEKDHGKGSVFSLTSRERVAVDVIPTGIWDLDEYVIGVGGMPRGRIVEIFGPEASGKTTAALATVASAQSAGGKAAYVDVEHALDPAWMQIQGVNIDSLLVSQPDFGEQALQIVDTLLDSYAFDVIVVDSVAALVPKAELEGDIGDAHVGLQARLMSQAMRKFTSKVHRSNTTLIFINQIREKIGVTFGSPETTAGGRALKFYSSLRLDIRRIGQVKDGDEIVGNKTKIKCVKNKLSAPYRQAEVDLLYGVGWDKFGSLFDAAVNAGVVHKSGSWFSYDGERVAQGRTNAIAALAAAGKVSEIGRKVREVAK
jgi:recombination protein RecA